MQKVAIAYDFDGTLARGNIQENSFIPRLNTTKEEFWREVKTLSEEHNMDEILSYMYLITKKAEEKNHRISKEDLKEHGKNVKYFSGVEEFFDRINEYGQQKNIQIKHYIISSGTKEMIEGTTIAAKFENIFASSFMYDNYGKPIWPALAINYTTKTQYLYRINKGIHNAWDNKSINKFIPEEERDIKFENIIFLGDGETDIPIMKLVKSNGGTSIAVFEEKEETATTLLKQDRVNFIAKADYSEGGGIDILLKSIIDHIALSGKYGKTSIQNKDTEDEKQKEFKVDKKKYLECLDTEGFKIEPQTDLNRIYLKKNEWDDLGYQTTFYIWNNGNYLGNVKIASKTQQPNIHTATELPDTFEKLPETFISKIQSFREDIVSSAQKEALEYLLNDISNTNEFDNLDVVKKSLNRNKQ